MMLRVYDKERKIEREITHKAYAALGPKRYEKLGPAAETTVTAARTTVTPQVHRAVSAPVIRPQIQESKPEAETQDSVQQNPERKKPGRKPKNQISSASDDAEK